MKLTAALILIILLASCVPDGFTLPDANLDANVIITDAFVSYGNLYIYFEVENLGDYVDYFEIYYEVDASDGSFNDWTNGLYIPAGGTVNVNTITYVGDAEVYTISVTDLYLWQW